jgi:Polysaccharide deacetylase
MPRTSGTFSLMNFRSRLVVSRFSRIVFGLLMCAGLMAGRAVEAAGPERVAVSDRGHWPDALDSPSAFDRASRAEILSFTAALGEIDRLDNQALAKAIRVQRVNPDSVRRWRNETRRWLLENFQRATVGCFSIEPFCGPAGSETELRALAAGLDESLTASYRPWRDDAREFHRVYVVEQLRLAALFPEPTNEILTVSQRERTGVELADRHFLLTFDDGPTVPGGATDATLAALRRAGVNAFFFLLGERLEARLLLERATELQRVYAGMCVASHGWSHESHQRLLEWQRSVDATAALLRQTFDVLYRPLFRPPYGERTLKSDALFATRGITVMLWNITLPILSRAPVSGPGCPSRRGEFLEIAQDYRVFCPCPWPIFTHRHSRRKG